MVPWTGILGSERLTGAPLHRLTHHFHILELNEESYRLKRSRENAVPQDSDLPDKDNGSAVNAVFPCNPSAFCLNSFRQ